MLIWAPISDQYIHTKRQILEYPVSCGVKEMDLKKTAIVILTYNNLEYSKSCLDSIRMHTEKESYEIIVVDNNSTDGTRDWLSVQPDIKLLLNDKNEGFPRGCNMGIALASPGSDILLLNNDTIVTPGWLANLQKCLYSDEKTGAAGAVCNHNENLQGVDFYYDSLEKMEELAQANNISDSSRWEEKIFLIGFCILIKREVLDKIGQLDETYSPGYVEDNDFSLRIISAGYRLMLCHDCFIHHYLGTGFRKDLTRFYPVLYKNRVVFQNRWGFETTAFDDVEFASLRIFHEQDQKREINVLELNCGIGVTLLAIKYKSPNARLFGTEPDENKARISGRIARVLVKAPGDFPLDFEEGSFDYIFIGSCLEWVENPELFLSNMIRYIKPGGFLIGKAGNVMHFSVIRDILKGAWQNAHGIINRSNRNHFTPDDLCALFAKCGFKNPYIFHWFSVPDEQEKRFIQNLCDIGEEKREYMYSTYLVSFRFQRQL